MPKHTGYSPTYVRALIRRAGVEVLRQRLAHGSVVSLPVSDVLRRANALLSEEDPNAQFTITTGAVGYGFGGKTGLQEAILADILGPQFGGANVAAAGRDEPPSQALSAMAAADHLNQTNANVPLMQTWLLVIADAAGSAAAGKPRPSEALTQSVYTSFDDELIPRYQDIAARTGRHLRPGTTWLDVSAAMTAVAEGVALRHLGDPSSREQALDRAVNFRAILWDGLTEPDDTAPSQGRADT